MSDDLALLTKAESIIERDAVMAMLLENNINSESPARDLSRKVTSMTPDISYEGYSAFFDGFKIFVKNEDLASAQRLLEKFNRETPKQSVSTDYANRFYLCAFSSIVFPVIFHALAIYNFVKAVQTKQKFSKFKLNAAILILFCSGWLGLTLVQLFLQ